MRRGNRGECHRTGGEFAFCYPVGQMSAPNFFDIAGLQEQRNQSGKRYLEFLRIPAMSAGIYVLLAGGSDPQTPHQEDELYYVARGRARMTVADEEQEVKEGSVILVAAEVEHRFHDIQEELVLLVFFAPAES
jgi:mannose-6-phosphate isomerase-like protein (cupin superfamily)